ncbi:MAG: AbrB/MazE/SpoVT family DNA-binding domain-containing protein [Dehalococcoidia bacterium]|nr:AbrB/MazE/SpoVT family DNA-binding domain-containing protein [Dehalococcoidia bacterium]
MPRRRSNSGPARMKVSRKGAVVIPRAIRERLGVREGCEVLVSEHDGGVSITLVPENPVEFWHGRFRGEHGASRALVEEHRREVADDEHSYRDWSARVERAW